MCIRDRYKLGYKIYRRSNHQCNKLAAEVFSLGTVTMRATGDKYIL